MGYQSDLLVEHVEAARWLYRSLMGPDDIPRKSTLVLLRGSGHPIHHLSSDPLAVPKGISVILVAVLHVFQVDLSLSFYHGNRMTNSGVESVEPARMTKSHYHECTSTRVAVPDEHVAPRGTLHLAWLHVEGQCNNPVFFLLEDGPDRNKHFEVVHKPDDLVHEYDAFAPPHYYGTYHPCLQGRFDAAQPRGDTKPNARREAQWRGARRHFVRSLERERGMACTGNGGHTNATRQDWPCLARGNRGAGRLLGHGPEMAGGFNRLGFECTPTGAQNWRALHPGPHAQRRWA
jgi:hypothetical protein